MVRRYPISYKFIKIQLGDLCDICTVGFEALGFKFEEKQKNYQFTQKFYFIVNVDQTAF